MSNKTGKQEVYTITGAKFPNQSISSATVAADFSKNGFRLPMEAQWEYAARGGNPNNTTEWNYTYSGGNTLNIVAWNYNNSGIPYSNAAVTHEVKQKQANALGIYDMSGNVCEWCWDICKLINNSILASPADGDEPIDGYVIDPLGVMVNTGDRFLRGGSVLARPENFAAIFPVTSRPNVEEYKTGKDFGIRICLPAE